MLGMPGSGSFPDDPRRWEHARIAVRVSDGERKKVRRPGAAGDADLINLEVTGILWIHLKTLDFWTKRTLSPVELQIIFQNTYKNELFSDAAENSNLFELHIGCRGEQL